MTTIYICVSFLYKQMYIVFFSSADNMYYMARSTLLHYSQLGVGDCFSVDVTQWHILIKGAEG